MVHRRAVYYISSWTVLRGLLAHPDARAHTNGNRDLRGAAGRTPAREGACDEMDYP